MPISNDPALEREPIGTTALDPQPLTAPDVPEPGKLSGCTSRGVDYSPPSRDRELFRG